MEGEGTIQPIAEACSELWVTYVVSGKGERGQLG
jgi:hypothetical protein